MRFFSWFSLALLLASTCPVLRAATPPGPPFSLVDGDRVVFIGDTFIEREQYHGWIEVMLTARFAGSTVTFRNLGWSGDTPAGDSRFGLSLLQAGHEPAGEGWSQLKRQVEEAKATVVMIGYGMASSFAGEAGLAKFMSDYRQLLDVIETASPGARVVILAPIPHENLGPPWPDPATHNAQLAAYSAALKALATERRLRLIPLGALLQERDPALPRLTDNGIHPHDAGYRRIAELIEDELVGTVAPGAWRTSAQTEPLRQAIIRKNEWFFHRSRPANMAYIFGFRKREQGRNAAEVLQFDQFIAAEEARIAQLRRPEPVDVPPVPRRLGNVNAPFTPQPHPQFDVADGFEVTLWAENPLLHKPVQMNFDAQGRLWVASSEMYPQIEPGQAPTDKIIVLEDTSGAGRADKATVFADGLLIPTGIEVGDGGAYVAQSTELLHFRDTDGDGKADVRRTVLGGFGTEDTHHNLHTLRWGPDGRLYLNQSVYTRTDTETPHGVVRLKAGGVFRFDPRDQRMEVLYRGWVNAWGHQFDDYGQSFLTDGAGNRGITWALPGATYQTLAPARRVAASISVGNYPKFCGIEVVRNANFPAEWQGDIVTCDFRAHRIVRFKLADQGAGFVTTERPDILRTIADTFRPIDVRFGPDGALYVADWSNPIIQHGEVDFRDPRRDKAHGRIWRVAAKGKTLLPKVDLAKLGNPELMEKLLSPNGYDEEHARRVLVERGAAAVLGDLRAWVARRPAGDEPAKLQALWLYQAFNQADAALLRALALARDPRVRAAATRALPSTGMTGELAKLVADENPRVRAEAVIALGKRGTLDAAERVLGVLTLPMDPFLEEAAWLAINALAEPWLAAVKDGRWAVAGREAQLEFGLKAVEATKAGEVLGQLIASKGVPLTGVGPWFELVGAAGGPRELRALVDVVVPGILGEPATLRALAALASAARLRGLLPAGGQEFLAPLLAKHSDKVRVGALQLAGAWKLKDVTPQVIATASDDAASPEVRTAAFTTLREIGGAEVITALKSLALPGSPLATRRDAAVELASLDLAQAMPEVITALRSTTDNAEAVALWRRLLAIQGLSAQLAAELPKAPLPTLVARAGLRPAREGTQHQALVPVLIDQAGVAMAARPPTPAELQALASEALAQGDAARGEKIYRRAELACMSCHAIGGAGGKLGPDLTSIGASAPADYLVESMLSPNAKIKEGYHSVLITTNDGRELNGMITRETATEVMLRDAANVESSIPTSAIAKRTSVGSLMPAGLLDTLLPDERLDLVKFLAQLGRPGDYDASQGGVARVWRLYTVTALNEHLGAERALQGDLGLDGWTQAYSLVNGALPAEIIVAADRDRRSARGLYAATRFESPAGGSVAFALSGQVKAAWLNGRAVKPGERFGAQAKRGANTLVLQLQQDANPAALKLSASGVAFELD